MQNQPTFSLIEVEPGRSLHYLLEGPESAPIILYDPGAFGIYADGWAVKEALKANFRVCLYDRAGMGASDPVPDECSPTPEFHVDDMRRLLTALGADGPTIIIGHSMSGLRMHAFANLYPNELRGIILVDALSPRNLKNNINRFAQDQFGNLLKLGAFGIRQSFVPPLVEQLVPNNFKLTGQMLKDKIWSYSAIAHHEGARNEVLAIDYDAEYLHGDGIKSVPLAIFGSTYLNGMKQADADAAKAATGYGWFGHYPREDHMSILMGVYADAIAKRAQEIWTHTADA